MEQRMQVAYHFKFDPAKTNIGQFEFPETIFRTITAGDRIIPEKVRIEDVPGDALRQLQVEAERLILEAHRTAVALPPVTTQEDRGEEPAEKREAQTGAPAAPMASGQNNALSLF